MRKMRITPSGYLITESDDPSIWEDDLCEDLTEFDILVEILRRLQ
jgi:hypothetical protein